MMTFSIPSLLSSSLLLLPLLLSSPFLVDAQNGRPSCDEFTTIENFAPRTELRYISRITDPATRQGQLTVEFTYAGTAWLALGFTENGQMVPGEAVIGLPGDVRKYDLQRRIRALSAVALQPTQTLMDTEFYQNITHTVLRFTKTLLEVNEIPINGDGPNQFLWAAGASNNLGYHGGTNRGVRDVNLIACQDEQVGVPVNETMSVTPTATPTTMAPTAAVVDCTQFQQSVELDGPNLVFEYVVSDYNAATGDGLFRARLTYQGTAWVSLGFVPNGQRTMVPGDAVIGLPDANNNNNNGAVEKYIMTARNPGGVQVAGADRQQNVLNGTVYQENGVTVMEFSRRLIVPNEQTIDGSGPNTFLWAYGIGNTLAVHRNRGIVALELQVCDGTPIGDGAGVQIEVIGGGNQQSYWHAHGILATVAWAILSPLAIASSMLRRFLPSGKLWLRLHVWLHLTVFVLTVSAFGTAVAAYENIGREHFTGVTHATVGLVIMIFSALQVLGGIFRASAPHKNDDGSMLTKTTIRKLWELGHKSVGAGLLVVCWWQIHTGLGLMVNNGLMTTNYSPLFWGVVSGIVSITFILFVFDMISHGEGRMGRQQGTGSFFQRSSGALHSYRSKV